MSLKEIQILIVGMAGAGKSSTGNTIVGKQTFNVNMTGRSATREYQAAVCQIEGRPVTVIDTASWSNKNTLSSLERQELENCLQLTANKGVDVFLLVIGISEFNKDIVAVMKKLKAEFGQDIPTYTIVVFTGACGLLYETFEDYKEKKLRRNRFLRRFLKECNDRCIIFDNHSRSPEQVRELSKLIDNMKASNKDSIYTSDKYYAAQRRANINHLRLHRFLITLFKILMSGLRKFLGFLKG